MKKEYTTPVIEIIVLNEEDIVTSSPVVDTFDPNNLLNDENKYNWF